MEAKYIVQISAALIALSASSSALAQMDPIIPSDRWGYDSDYEIALYNATGFPVNYDQPDSCGAFSSTATFKKIFIAKNMPPKIRDEIERVISKLGGLQVITQEKEAELLIHAGPIVDGASTLGMHVYAVSSRPMKTKRGARCITMSVVKTDVASLGKYFESYMRKMASNEGGPFHFAGRDRYAMKGSCYKLIPDVEILAFGNIFIADSPSHKITQAIEKKIAAIEKYTIVSRAADADYIVTIGREFYKNTTQTINRGMSGTQTDGNGDPNNPGNTTSSWSTPDTIETTTTTNESGELLVLAVKHPKNGEKQGLVCSAYKQVASKNAMFNIWNPRGTSGKLVDGLVKYLNNPDLTYKSVDY